MGKLRNNARLIVQACFTALSNGYVKGFAKGKIYTGQLKAVCLPGLNCYSCPGAFCSCPIGSLQATLGDRSYKLALYVMGFLALFGTLLGRFICGWLCPFGLLQDLLFKIPFVRKLKKLPGDRWLRYLKYVILALFVVLLPLLAVDIIGQGSPWFCKYICPSGTFMAGIPLVLLNRELSDAVGALFVLKIVILVLIVLLSVIVYRPFCRYLCPLGAVYGCFNPVSLYRYSVDSDKCTHCGACAGACKLSLKPEEKPNSTECIRCGDCIRACPHSAITAHFIVKKHKQKD